MAVSERLSFIIDADGAQARKEFKAIGADAESGLGKAEKKMATFSESLARIGKGAAVGTALYGLATAASDLGEAVNASNVVLGEAGDEVQGWAEGAAEAAGLSNTAALEVASSFGAIGKEAGISGGALADWSISLSQVSADLASVYNRETADVAQALASGLRGESEAAKALNIDLSDMALKNQLAKVTGDKVVGTLNQSEKAIAAYSKIMESTVDIQGDFSRTSEGLANTQKTAMAQAQNAAAELGETLAPVFSTLIGSAGDAAEGIANLPKPLKDTAVAAGLAYAGTQILGGGFGLIGNKVNDVGGKLTGYSDRVRGAAQNTAAANTAFGATRQSLQGVSKPAAAASAAAKGMGTAFRGAGAALAGPWGIALAGTITALQVLPGFLDNVTGATSRLEAAQIGVGKAFQGLDVSELGNLDTASQGVDEFVTSVRELSEANDTTWDKTVRFLQELAIESTSTSRSTGIAVKDAESLLEGLDDTLADMSLAELEAVAELAPEIFKDLDSGDADAAIGKVNKALETGRANLKDYASDQIIANEQLGIMAAEARKTAIETDKVAVTLDDLGGSLKAGLELLDPTSTAYQNLSESSVAYGKSTGEIYQYLVEATSAQEVFSAALDAAATPLDFVSGAMANYANAAKNISTGLEAADTDELVTGAIDVGDAFDDLGENISKLPGHFDAAKAASGGYADEQENALKSLISVGDAIKENGATIIEQTGNTDEAVAAIKEQSQALRTDLVEGFQAAGIGAGEAGAKADEYLRILGLTPEQIETTIELSKAEEAKQNLGLLQGQINSLPPNVQTTVTQQIIAGDYQGALTTVSDYYSQNPAKMPVDADTSPAAGTVRSFLFGGGGGGSGGLPGLGGGPLPKVGVGADMAPATQDAAAWTPSGGGEEGGGGKNINVGANMAPATAAVAGWQPPLVLQPKINVGANTAPALAAVAALSGTVKGKVTMPVVAETRGAARQVDLIHRAVEKKATKPIDANSRAAVSQLRSLETAIGRSSTKPVFLGLGDAYNQIYALETRLRQTITKTVHLRTTGGGADGDPATPQSLAPGAGIPIQNRTVINNTVNLPAGANGADVTRALRRHQARNGVAA